jgi:hypothetical protein
MAIVSSIAASKDTKLLLCTFKAYSLDYIQQLKDLAQKYRGLLHRQVNTDADYIVFSEISESKEEAAIQVVPLDRQTVLIQTIAKSRVLIDLGDRINRHISSEAVSSGVPQINRIANPNTTHKVNGYIVKDSTEIKDALDYFLVGLQNWDGSLIRYAQLKAQYSDRQVLAQWEGLNGGRRQ